jgi:uncharacterized protein (TIGR03067 family)
MRRTVYLLAGVLLVLPSLGSDSPKGYNGATESASIEGAWQLVEIVWNGRVRILEVGCVWTYRNGKETIHEDGRLLGERPYTVDASSRPARMDCVETEGKYKGKIFRHIYRVEGDTLRIAQGSPGGECPQSFEDKDTYVHVYKRIK